MVCSEEARCRGESRSGFPSTLDFFFCQLKRKSENPLFYNFVTKFAEELYKRALY